jgi:hypothetical protein
MREFLKKQRLLSALKKSLNSKAKTRNTDFVAFEDRFDWPKRFLAPCTGQ